MFAPSLLSSLSPSALSSSSSNPILCRYISAPHHGHYHHLHHHDHHHRCRHSHNRHPCHHDQCVLLITTGTEDENFSSVPVISDKLVDTLLLKSQYSGIAYQFTSDVFTSIHPFHQKNIGLCFPSVISQH